METILDPNCIDYYEELTQYEFDDDPLYQEVANFHQDGPALVSLSGGVDSMVLATILSKITTIVVVHINYGNRGTENEAEVMFLRHWCEQNNITIHICTMEIKRGDVDRKEYETISRSARFQSYNRIIELYNMSNDVYVGHHADDIVENMFTNYIMARALTDLPNLDSRSENSGVILCRPFLPFRKDKIFEFAHRYKIPYFKDTTPDWSRRGILRRQTLPHLYENYGRVDTNLLRLANESRQLGSLIDRKIFDPLFENNQDGWYELEEFAGEDEFFWKKFFSRLFHGAGKSMPSNKSIKNFITYLTEGYKGNIMLTRDVKALVIGGRVKFDL